MVGDVLTIGAVLMGEENLLLPGPAVWLVRPTLIPGQAVLAFATRGLPIRINVFVTIPGPAGLFPMLIVPLRRGPTQRSQL